MELIKVSLKDITPYDKNPRINDDAVEAVMESIKQCSYISPIVVDEDMVILAGHTRYKALKKLRRQQCEVIVKEGLTEEQKRKYRILDNKTNEFAVWDDDLLSEELIGLDFDGFDFGFDLGVVDEEEISEAKNEEDEIPEVDEESEPLTAFGDIYQLGRHRLMCGDSTDKECIDLLMDGKKADMVLSDPPYGMHLDTDYSDIKGFSQGNKYEKVIGDNDDFKPELITTFIKHFGYCKEMFLFGADYFAEILPEKNDGSWCVWDKRKESQADGIGAEFELIWSKAKHKRRMLRHDWFGFLSSENAQDARNRVHPTQKPVSLLKDIINQWGEKCENVVDLYGGSGSTLIACEELNRTCYMMELDPKYCDVIVQRWENLTGEKAVLING